MSRFTKGLLLAALHVALVMGMTVKYAVDRQTLPRVWVRTVPYDLELPIRGRYVELRMVVDGSRLAKPPGWEPWQTEWVKLSVENDRLVAVEADSEAALPARRTSDGTFLLDDGV